MRIAFTFNLQCEATAAEAEFDTAATVSMIGSALEELGHVVHLVNVNEPLADVIGQLQRFAPDLVFNTAEGQHGRGREALFPAIFEHLELPYTGSDSLVCALTLDKHLTKKVLEPLGVDMPRGLLVRDLDDEALRSWDCYPCLIKPNSEGSSKGIDRTSVIRDAAELEPQLRALLAAYPAGVLVEEFVAGLDVVVPYLETTGVLEPASYVHRQPSELSIYSYDQKLHGFDDLVVRVPADISAEVRERAMQVTARIVKALDIRDFARLDFRLDADGRLRFLEINALPSLETGASIYLSAALAGLEGTSGVLESIIESASSRRPGPAVSPLAALGVDGRLAPRSVPRASSKADLSPVAKGRA